MCDHYNENNGEKEVENGNDIRMQGFKGKSNTIDTDY